MTIEFLAVLLVGVLVGGVAAYGLVSSSRKTYVVLVQDADGRTVQVAGPYASAADASRAALAARIGHFTVERLSPEPPREL